MKLFAYFFIIFIYTSQIFGNNIAKFEDDEHEFLEFHLPKDLTYLKLSQKQNNQIKKVLLWYQEEINKFNNNKRVHILQIKTLFLEKEFDDIHFIENQQQYHNDKTIIQSKFLSEIHKILTKNQREKFIKYINEWEIE